MRDLCLALLWPPVLPSRSPRSPRLLPLLYADPVLLAQLLANLLENVAQYTPAGTHVEINAEVIGDELELRVVDDGPGLAAEVAPEQWFEKFRRGGRAGVGLGLAICRAIAHAHGGRIRAENIPAGGAMFVLSLPLSGPAPTIDSEEATTMRRDDRGDGQPTVRTADLPTTSFVAAAITTPATDPTAFRP